MGYFYTLMSYLKTEKARHDIADYARAIITIAVVTAMVMIIVDMFR